MSYGSDNLKNAVTALDQKVWSSPVELEPYVPIDEPNRGRVLTHADQAKKIPQMESYITLSQYGGSTGSGSGNASNGAQFQGQTVEFRLDPNSGIKWIKNLLVQYQLKETSAGTNCSVTPIETHELASSIEIWVNGNQDKYQTLLPKKMLYALDKFHSPSQIKRICRMAGISPLNYQGSQPIYSGQTSERTWPLIGNFIHENGGLWLPAIKDSGEISIKLNLRNGATKSSVNSSGSAAPVLGIQNIVLLLETEVFHPDIEKEYASRWNDNTLELNFMETVVTPTNYAITAGTEVPLQLTPVLGLMAYGNLLIRADNTTVTNGALNRTQPIGTHLNGASWKIDTQDGNTIASNLPWQQDLVRTYIESKYFPGEGDGILDNWHLALYGDPLLAHKKAINQGFVRLTGKEYLKFTTAAQNSLVSTNYLIGTATNYQVVGGATADAHEGLEMFTIGFSAPTTSVIPTLGTMYFTLGPHRSKAISPVANAADVSHGHTFANPEPGTVAWALLDLCKNTVGRDGTPIVPYMYTGSAPSASTTFFTDGNTCNIGFGNLPIVDLSTSQSTTLASTDYYQSTLERAGLAFGIVLNAAKSTILPSTVYITHATFNSIVQTGVPNMGFTSGTYYIDFYAEMYRHGHWNENGSKRFSPVRLE
jgi:hypothetical protein